MNIQYTKISIAVALLTSSLAMAAGGGGVVADPGAMQGKHFDSYYGPKSKAILFRFLSQKLANQR